MLMHQELVEVFQIFCCSIVNAHHIVGAFLHGLLVLFEAFYLPDIGTYYGCLSFLKAFCLNVLLHKHRQPCLLALVVFQLVGIGMMEDEYHTFQPFCGCPYIVFF